MAEQDSPEASRHVTLKDESRTIESEHGHGRKGDSIPSTARSSHGRRHFHLHHLHLPPEARLPSYTSFLSKRNRQKTELNDTTIGGRAFPHKYVIRRPRALQYRYKGKVYQPGDSGRTDLHVLDSEKTQEDEENISTSASSEHTSVSESEHGQERTTDNIDAQRERLDLFIDLLWVGIISNISEHFYEKSFAPDASIGQAVLEFLVLFLPAWSIWVVLQTFLNSFFMDDILQRIFILWILVCGLTYGNNAPFLLSSVAAADYLIITYIVAKNSIALFEVAYSFFIPWLRRRMLFGFFLLLPSTGLWIAATLVAKNWARVTLLIVAIVYDYVIRSLFSSSLEGRLMKDGITKARDEKHMLRRYESFFVIALGEGVFLLIRGSPAGRSFSDQLGRSVLALLLYFALHWIYFNGDQTKTFVHALYRRWYVGVLWSLCHIALYGNLVLLSSGMLYLIDYTPDGETNGVPEGTSESKILDRAESAGMSGEPPKHAQEGMETAEAGTAVSTSHDTLRAAEVTVCVNLAIILLTSTIIALLNRPLDKPGTLLVNNRYVRLLPRMCAVVVFSTVWLYDFKDATGFIGTLVIVVAVVFQWEWHAGLERNWRFLEPKDSWKQEQ